MPRFRPDPATILFAITATCLALALPAPGSPALAQDRQEATAEGEEEDELFDPSDTGYLDSAIIRNAVRVRFDAASGADRPDRAEFLYGKCTCFAVVAGQDGVSPGPAADLDFQEVELSVERAFGARWSLFAEVPYRSIDLTLPTAPVDFTAVFGLTSPEIDNSGLGDVRVGGKYALVAGPDRWVTLQLRAYLPTGDAADNLGTDHATVEPAILYYSRLSDRWALTSEARLWIPLSGSSDPATGAGNPASTVGRIEPPGGTDPPVRNDGFAGNVFRYGLGLSYAGRGARVRLSPIVELVGWYVLDGYETPPAPGPTGFVVVADDTSILNLKVGARIDRGRSDSIYIGYGSALTNDDWYDGILRVEYRFSW